MKMQLSLHLFLNSLPNNLLMYLYILKTGFRLHEY